MPTTALPALVVLGSINHDIIATTARLPEPGETIGDGTLSDYPGGKGANQAAAAARLGARVGLVGAVGDDDAGRRICRDLRLAGVSTDLVSVAAAPTGTALIVVDAHGENQIAVCPGANAHIDVESAAAELAAADVVLAQLEIPLAAVLTAARTAKGYFAVNAAPAQPLPAELIERCDLIIVNETEYAEMPELAEAKLVAVTYGGDGAALREHGRETHRVPAVKATVVNSVGAGDSFCAALVLGLAANIPPLTALRVAAAVGADAVSHAASQPPLLPWSAYETATQESVS
ncbi:ribokinase [Arthrobacter sp. ERGS1:01]|uniref:ribokinase n=1 Tax=Arthrobacter sp. ERGS1:01 TaxID=1704044 RepID=UPI0006B44D20|nr:ribokinase [Arthrobacter sp. ERGS1:01]ALE05367.1 ribokinase [Arthrobacter sp. ERGS1:01]